jgi:hypothetical protein
VTQEERLDRLNRRFRKPEDERTAAGQPCVGYDICCDAPGCTSREHRPTIPELAAAIDGWHVGLDVGYPDDCPKHRTL